MCQGRENKKNIIRLPESSHVRCSELRNSEFFMRAVEQSRWRATSVYNFNMFIGLVYVIHGWNSGRDEDKNSRKRSRIW